MTPPDPQTALRPDEYPPRPLALRMLRGLSGAVAAGLVILAGVMAVSAWITDREGAPGPSTTIVLGHATVAVLAVLAQVIADRSPGRARALLATIAVLVLGASTLWVWWWS